MCIVRLLLQQTKHVRETPPEERANAVYVQDISLEKNKAYVAEHILSDIFTVSTRKVCAIQLHMTGVASEVNIMS